MVPSLPFLLSTWPAARDPHFFMYMYVYLVVHNIMYVLVRYLVATVFYISIGGGMSRNGGGNDDLNVGLIVGVTVPVAFVIIIVVVAILIYWRLKKAKKGK